MTAGAGWSIAAVDAQLADFVAAGVLGRAEVHLAAAAKRLVPSASPDALLALALAARSSRLGHVCLELTDVRRQIQAAQDDEGTVAPLPLPDPGPWAAELAGSDLVAAPERAGVPPLRPLVRDGSRLYLQRYWAFEVAVAREVRARSAAGVGAGPDLLAPAALESALDQLFDDPGDEPDLQRLAARRALSYPVSVIAGGPGTGKTHTVARILAAAHLVAGDQGGAVRIALAAPTGKAAARMRELVVEQVERLAGSGRIDPAVAAALVATVPTTVHRLLGPQGRSRFRHDASAPLGHDLVIIDETSMVSLPLLARLMDAVRPDARLVLVGDPFQLTSIEAGTVMADLAGPGGGGGGGGGGDGGDVGSAPMAGRVTELLRGRRIAAGSARAALARAIRDGDADRVLHQLAAGGPEVHWVRADDVPAREGLRSLVDAAAREVVASALAGDGPAALAAAKQVKILAAVRRGPLGLDEWSDAINAAVQDAVPPAHRSGWPRVGTPVMVTGNDPVNDLANGDVGVVVQVAGRRWVAMDGAGTPRLLAPARLGRWEPWWTTTIHKSQGSEFPHAVVSLPTRSSPVLTRELLYTAVTRATVEVTVVASEEAIRAAVVRPVARASGLCDRLWPPPTGRVGAAS